MGEQRIRINTVSTMGAEENRRLEAHKIGSKCTNNRSC
jgi:hypothetical protein